MKKISCGLVMVICALFVFLVPYLYASSGKAPISGTPFFREKKKLLLRDYGPAARIKAERTIFADTVGQQIQFWAFNFSTGAYYKDQSTLATCRKVTSFGPYNLYIYVSDDEWTRDQTRFSDTILSNISSELVNTIRPTETTYFGTPPGGDFTVLLLDIKDSGGNTFVSGYFDTENELTPGSGNHSNGRHMIYMDSKDGTPGNTSFYGTLAHEFSHFIQFDYDPNEETWVEEGLAGLARYVCGYGPQASHVNSFGLAPNTSLTAWEDTLENYGAAFLFILYLEEHYGGAVTTKAIVANPGAGIDGINTTLHSRGYPSNVTVNEIFKNWVVANYLNNSSLSSGVYGYQANFSSYPDIVNGPGNIRVTSTVSNYPASGSGTLARYSAQYVRFGSLDGTYNIFVLIPYSLDEGEEHDYSYTARLGSLILNLTGLSSLVGASGVKQGTSNPTPAVVTNLSASSSISTDSGGGSSSSSSGSGSNSSSSSSNSSGGGGCFIATAAFGSPLSGEVSTLRQFRDKYLLTNLPGRGFVSVYYRVSPPVAQFIGRHESLKGLTRIMLYPVVGLSRCFLDNPQGIGFLGLGVFLLIGFVLVKQKNFRTRINTDEHG